MKNDIEMYKTEESFLGAFVSLITSNNLNGREKRVIMKGLPQELEQTITHEVDILKDSNTDNNVKTEPMYCVTDTSMVFKDIDNTDIILLCKGSTPINHLIDLNIELVGKNICDYPRPSVIFYEEV